MCRGVGPAHRGDQLTENYGRYLIVFLRSMICSVAVLAATNSEPYVAVSTVACLFENQSVGVVLTKCNTAVTNFPLQYHG